MKTITVSTRSKVVNDLLKKARHTNILLQSGDGQHFVLAFVENWQCFDVGVGNDFSDEVKKTARNRKLMKFLAERRRKEGKRISLSKIKEEISHK